MPQVSPLPRGAWFILKLRNSGCSKYRGFQAEGLPPWWLCCTVALGHRSRLGSWLLSWGLRIMGVIVPSRPVPSCLKSTTQGLLTSCQSNGRPQPSAHHAKTLQSRKSSACRGNGGRGHVCMAAPSLRPSLSASRLLASHSSPQAFLILTFLFSNNVYFNLSFDHVFIKNIFQNVAPS